MAHLISDKISCTDTYLHVINDIHFKYNLAGERDRILTSVAHLRKKAELKVVGVLEVRTWSGAGVSVLVCTRGAAFEMDWWKFGGVCIHQSKGFPRRGIYI